MSGAARIAVRLGLGVLVVLVGLLLLGGAWLLVGAPGGTRLAESVLQDRQIGRFGTLDIRGVRGSLTRAITIDQVMLVDREKVWLVARDIEVQWRPRALLQRVAHVERISARSVAIIGVPLLDPAEPSGPLPVDIRLDRIGLTLRASEAVAGPAARSAYAVQAAASVRRDDSFSVAVSGQRLDRPGDGLALQLSRTPAGALSGRVSLAEAPGGLLAGLAQLDPKRTHAVIGSLGGSIARGGATLRLLEDRQLIATLQAQWTPDDATLAARARVTRFAPAAALAPLGEVWNLRARLADRSARPMRLAARLTSSRAALDLAGTLPAADTAGALDITARVPALAGLGPGLGVADLEGAAALTGRLTGTTGRLRYAGQLQLTDLRHPQGRIDRLGGPVVVSLQPELIRAETDLAAEGVRLADASGVPGQLLGNAPRLQLRVARVRASGDWGLEQLRLTTPFGQINGTGTVLPRPRASGSFSLAGLRRITPQAPDRLTGNWSIAVPADGPLAGRLTGTASGLGGPDSLGAALLGSAARFDIRLDRPAAGVSARWMLDSDRLDSEGSLLWGARPQAQGRWRFSGPAEIGPVLITGVADGTLTLADGRLTTRARLPVLAAGGQRFSDVVLTTTGRLDGTTLRSDIVVTGQGSGGPLRLVGAVDTATPRLVVQTLRYAGLDARGEATLTSGRINGAFDLALRQGALLPSGSVDAALRVATRGQRTDVTLQAQARGIAGPGQRWSVAAARIDARGPLERLAIEAQGNGSWQGSPWQGRLDARFSQSPQGQQLRGTLAGTVAGQALATRQPIVLAQQGDTLSAAGALSWGAAQLVVDARRTPQQLDASVRLDALDLRPLSETTLPISGVASATLTARGPLDRVRADLDLQVVDARPLGTAAGSGASLRLVGQLADGQLTAQASATSAAGLDARAAVATRARLDAEALRLIVDRAAPLSGSVTANGDIGPLARVALGSSRRLSGNIALAARLGGRLDAPDLNGTLALDGGMLRDSVIGLRLQDLTLRSRFSRDQLTIDRLTATDGSGGTLSGSGALGLSAASDARLVLQLTGMTLIDRRDAEIELTGPATVTRRNGQLRLETQLRINRADIQIPDQLPAGVTAMPVREINRPATLGAAPLPEPPPPPLALAVSLSAIDGVRVRGRGIDADFGLDVSVAGTAADPQPSGEVRLNRGTFDLAGRRFQFESGTISLDPEISNTRLNFRAVRETPELTAVVQVTGTIANPEIVLSSIPALPQDEVISRVLFGRSVVELSALEAARLGAAVAGLAGGGGFDAFDTIGSLLGLDRFSLAGDGGGVALGKQLLENVYVEVEAAGGDGSAVALEWRPWRRLVVRARVTQTQSQEFSVRWRRDFD